MKKHQPVYCLVGEDWYRKSELLSEIKSRLLTGDNASLNYEYLLAGEVAAARILDAVRTPAWDLFSSGGGGKLPSRLVVVEGAEVFPDGEWQKLEEYFSAPDPDSCLVFLVNKLPGKWKEKKYLPDRYLVSYSPLKGKQLVKWIGGEASRRGLRLTPKQLDQCAIAAGNDPGAIAAGLEKLAIYRGRGGSVPDRELRELIGFGQEGTVFNLTELAAAGKAGEALALLNRLLDEGEKPLKLLSLISGSVRKLWLGVDAYGRTKNTGAALEAAGVRFYREQFIRQVKSLGGGRIAYWYRRLVETDWAVKGGEKDPRLALERLMVDLSRTER